jgi:hypothetical protein
MANFSSAPALDGVDFIANVANLGGTGYGGGVYNFLTNPSPSFRNVVFSRNTALDYGGGLYNFGSWGTLTNATFSGNFAQYGGAVFNANNSNPPVNNCIFWGDAASQEGPEIYNQETTPTIRSSDIEGCGGSGVGWDAALGIDGGGNLDEDPLFVDAGADNLRLVSGSPGIDAGDDSLVPAEMTTDRDGNARISGLAVDMGAFEIQVPSLAPGLVSTVAAADVMSLAAFHATPKVYVTYFDPVKDPDKDKLKKASLKVLTKVDKALGTPTLACEWTKKIKLYDAKAFKAAQKGGESAETWIPANQENLPVDLCVASKEIVDGDQPLYTAMLTAPEILTATVSAPEGVTVVTLEGNWFGTKKSKVWREYEVDNGGDIVVKQQVMKVLKPTVDNTDCLDSKLKPAYMNAATGASKVIVIVPTKEPKGALNGVIVIDNGVGMAVEALK